MEFTLDMIFCIIRTLVEQCKEWMPIIKIRSKAGIAEFTQKLQT